MKGPRWSFLLQKDRGLDKMIKEMLEFLIISTSCNTHKLR